MANCIESLYKVDADNEGFESMLFLELEYVFKGEDGVVTAYILETAALGFQTVIANVWVHLIQNGVGVDFVCAIEETDGAPVVRVDGVPFLSTGVKFPLVHLSRIEAPC